MAIQLATNELSSVNDAPFRNLLISNFATTQEVLNELLTYQGNINQQLSTLTTNINTSVDGKLSAQDQVTVNRLKQQAQELTARINRIIMGTDTDAIIEVLQNIGVYNESGTSLTSRTYPFKAIASSFSGQNYTSLDLYWTCLLYTSPSPRDA